MRVVLSVVGKFHTFDLARQLDQRGALRAVFTGYPHFKLRGEALPRHKIRTFPWLHTPYMATHLKERLGRRFLWAYEYADMVTLDWYVSRRLPECEVFVGLSGSGLHTGREAKRRGGRYVCDRGSTHIRYQDQVLQEEHARWGMEGDRVNPQMIEREEQEYAEADCITVPSRFNVRSFVAQGVPAHKLQCLPYGVDLSRFHPTGEPDPSRLDVLFAGGMSLRKGVPYLLAAFKAVKHPRKSLTFAGTPSVPLIERMKHIGLWSDDIRVLGHVPQAGLKDLMSRSHVLVLPSIEEGLALVQAQAMACGCPVLATPNTGAEDLFTDGREGWIVPIRNSAALAERLQQLADDFERGRQAGAAALSNVRSAGGWTDYGAQALSIYRGLVSP